jgi:hypothetical protein
VGQSELWKIELFFIAMDYCIVVTRIILEDAWSSLYDSKGLLGLYQSSSYNEDLSRTGVVIVASRELEWSDGCDGKFWTVGFDLESHVI